jgi:hypothetical protein
MSSAASLAIGTIILGALLGGVVNATFASLDRRRERRAAALVVYDALVDALARTQGAAQESLMKPVVIPFEAYAKIWETERKPLARSIPALDYADLATAFSNLEALRRAEALGEDLREEIYDALHEAGQSCEKARRVAWRKAQTPKARIERRFRLWIKRVKERWGHLQVARQVQRVRNGRRRREISQRRTSPPRDS